MSTSVALIGMGYWGKNLARNLHQLGALHTVCEADASRQADVEEKYPGVAFSGDLEAVLANKEIGAVAIATPAVTHFSLVKKALQAGKDVFVEKPLAVSVKEGAELVKLAGELGRILFVGHILQYHPAVLKLKELIDGGALGKVQYLYSNRLNHGKIRTEENILWSFAPHDISVMLGLLGEVPEAVSCQGGAYLSPDVADVTVSQFTFPSGVKGHIFVSWLHPMKEQRLVVVGSEKMAVFDDTATDKLVLYPHKVEWKDRVPTAIKAEAEIVELPAGEPLKAECAHFLECCESRRAPRTDGTEGLNVLRILDACQRSMDQQGGNVGLESPGHAAQERDWFCHPTAVVDEPSDIGAGTKIWHYSHVMPGAKIGKKCVFGQNVNIDGGTVIGNNVKVQNNVSIYTGLVIEDDVFLGPSCVLTNVTNPRSQVNRHSLYETTIIRRGASVGANATIVCGITMGRYCLIGSGSVVTKDVPDYAMMVGVPAKKICWVSRHGLPMKEADANGVYTCPESGLRYQENAEGQLRCLDLDEEAPLPDHLAKGEEFYDQIVHGKRLTNQDS